MSKGKSPMPYSGFTVLTATVGVLTVAAIFAYHVLS